MSWYWWPLIYFFGMGMSINLLSKFDKDFDIEKHGGVLWFWPIILPIYLGFLVINLIFKK